MPYEELIKYMESHSEFAAGKFLTKEGKIHHAEQWEEVAKMLNALSNHLKTTKQWQTVFNFSIFYACIFLSYNITERFKIR